MEYVIGILLLVSFVGLAVYAVRGGNLMMGMLIMGIIWTVLPLIGNTFATNPEFIAAYPGITDISFVDAITKVFQSGPEGWGSVLVNVVFGAWFGRVLLQTGIADALIRKAVELGGDKPVIICVLLSTVTTAIFSTLFGAGAVVAIGVIILPILMSLGIPKTLSIGSFMLSVGAGMYLNPVLTGQFLAFFLGEDGKQLITYDDPARLGRDRTCCTADHGDRDVHVFSEKEENCSCMECIRRKKSTSGICSDSCADRTDPSGFTAGCIECSDHSRIYHWKFLCTGSLWKTEIFPGCLPCAE